MPTIPVQFTYLTGLRRTVFRNPRLTGSWDGNGRYSDNWSTLPMREEVGDDGCPCFTARVSFDATQAGRVFRWGVLLDGPGGVNAWGIATEVNDHLSTDRSRSFILAGPASGPQEERYYLTHCRRLGAQKYYPPGARTPAIRFAVWAPNARDVHVVFGKPDNGYVADNGEGIDTSRAPIPLVPTGDGVWETDLARSPELADYAAFVHRPYMFRITKEGGAVAYRTDLYSRSQIGTGKFNPGGNAYAGKPDGLDGRGSCSVVIDPDSVDADFEPTDGAAPRFVPEEEFWKDEFTHDRPLPQRVEDLVIYELHVGALGAGQPRAGNLGDAMALLDTNYLEDLGVNAVELLPMAEFGSGDEAWGYGNSHHFAVESAAGGRDELKHFIRACHRRGIAVILDVVYNHFALDAERAEWAYDSDSPEHNIYYWYEGKSSDYADPRGGFVDNDSSGWAPRYWEENVRKLFAGSAAALVEEFHVDGFRVDLVNAMHALNALHADGRPLGNANIFGAKLLREWSRTVKMLRPATMLVAEDHSGWDRVTELPDLGGLGFDAAWYVNFYHHLVGNPNQGPEFAKMLLTAGLGDDRPLAEGYFAGALGWSGQKKVVYHESHDEAGNAAGSQRTIRVAVNGAPLVGITRRYAEARCRLVFGLSVLSAGTPMFLMGEEIGAQKPYRVGDFLNNREDLLGDRHKDGKDLFHFYQDAVRLRLDHPGLRSREVDVLYTHDANRVIAFRRWSGSSDFLVVGSLNNQPFRSGYGIDCPRLPAGDWREVFNSDAAAYGGDNVGNGGAVIPSAGGHFNAVLPANGFVVFKRE